MSLNYTNPTSGAEVPGGGIIEIGYSSVSDGFLTTIILRRDNFTDETIYSGGSFEEGYTGSRSVSGTNEVLKFRRNDGWGDSSEFQLVLDDGVTETTLNYVVAGAGDALAFMAVLGPRARRLYLNTLRDVEAPLPNDTEVLGYDAAQGKWTPRAPSTPGSHVLNSHSDVNTVGVTDGQALVYDQGTGTWIPGDGGGGGVSDHGALLGLSDDDHVQYHTDARGDARYYTQAQVDDAIGGISGAIQNKLDAVTKPDQFDDSGAGYSVGSTWVDVASNQTWVCVDSTAGAAQWRRTSNYRGHGAYTFQGTGTPTGNGALTANTATLASITTLTFEADDNTNFPLQAVHDLMNAANTGVLLLRQREDRWWGTYNITNVAPAAGGYAYTVSVVSSVGPTAAVGEEADVWFIPEPGTGGAGATAIGDLTDVTIQVGGIQDGDFLVGVGGVFINGQPSFGDMLSIDNLSSLTNVVAARDNLGLGSAAEADLGTGDGEVPVYTSGDIPATTFTAGSGSDFTEFRGSGVVPYDANTTTWTIGGVTDSTGSPIDISVLGTKSGTTGVAGGTLNVFGGNATVGNADGGNLNIAGGASIGTGVQGKIVAEGSEFQLLNIPLTTNSTIQNATTDDFAAIVAADSGGAGPSAGNPFVTVNELGALGGGDVSKTGTPVIGDFARFTGTNTIEGRDFSQARADLGIDSAATSAAWGNISGTLSNQIDLQAALDAKGSASQQITNTAKLAGIEVGATADQAAGEIEAIVNHDNLLGFVPNEHIDWTQPGAGTIDPSNYSSGSNDLADLNPASGTFEQLQAAIANGGLERIDIEARGAPGTAGRFNFDPASPNVLSYDNGVTWDEIGGGGGSGTVDTSGTPLANDFARFTDANTIEGRSYAEVRADLGLEINTDVQAYSAALDAVSGTNTGDQTITLTGDVTGSGTGSFATTISTDAVDIAMLSATGTADGTTFLRGDNTWAVPSSSQTKTELDTSVVDADLFSTEPDEFATLDGGISEKAIPVSGDRILIEDSAASFAKKYAEIGNLPGGSETNNLESVCTGIGANEIAYGTGADTAAYATIASLTDEPSPTTGDHLLIQTTEGLRSLDIANLPSASSILTGTSDPPANTTDFVAGEFYYVTTSQALWYNDAGTPEEVGISITGQSEKVAPVSADQLLIADSEDSDNLKRVQISNLPSGGGSGDVSGDTTSVDHEVASYSDTTGKSIGRSKVLVGQGAIVGTRTINANAAVLGVHNVGTATGAASGVGSTALGYNNQISGNCLLEAAGSGTLAVGSLLSLTGDATLKAAGAGSIVFGSLSQTSAGTCEISTATAAAGALAGGYAAGTGTIEATASASFALGYCQAGRSITASGTGSFAFGISSTADIVASASNAMQLGHGTNAIATSLQVGSAGSNGIQIIGSGDPGSGYQNGMVWSDGTHVYVHTNGITKSMSNI